MAEYRIFTVDAFASKLFGGNQAAVVLAASDRPISDSTMQALAAEMNISETAFLTPLENQGEGEFCKAARFSLRWFTPTVEADLCGHATLAAAQVLIHELQNKHSELHFETLSGVLSVRPAGDGKLDMTFPADSPKLAEVSDDLRLIAACVAGRYSPTTEIAVSPALRYMLVHDPTLTDGDIAALAPRITPDVFAAGQREHIQGVIITARGSDRDFKSRFFAPWCGIDEDPVTGSAHTVLAPFWADRLGKSTFVAQQCSPRCGELDVALAGDGRVVVSGRAVVVIRGTVAL
ncbi:hypothetical protein LPJ61_003030 [Coemansia biformis]|uniref:Phenazine biosynthesis PhzC/PhzF protein n=1 Tax=Coemansia biformis TaxID=1286918 RepID=A0A9W8CY34_9FUNG|nr:hypothetical protein LPJ61_003030 [Coemansia biformis]